MSARAVDLWGHQYRDESEPRYFLTVSGSGHVDAMTRAELHEVYAQAATLLGLPALPDPGVDS